MMPDEIIVERIIEDLQGRCGLGDLWDELDQDFKDRILAKWRELTRSALADWMYYAQDKRG